MDRYNRLRQIIENAGDSVDFAEFGEGVLDEWIVKAEKRSNILLPESYKWWLKNYGGGEIYGEEIFSIYEQDFDSVIGGDIVYMYEKNKKLHNFPSNMLVICEADDETFYFDTSEDKIDNEYAVYTMNTRELYANDFIEFLEKRILN
ncbi:MAG: SMI1/KNR4 family protein [Acetatifactor sp.]|nr:SMI1/KNR4 family protein [Acetatifactor sp.]